MLKNNEERGLFMESYNVMISRFDVKLFISGERKTLYVKIKLHIKRSEKYYPTSVVIEDETILSKLKDWMTSHSASIYYGAMTMHKIDKDEDPITRIRKCVGLEIYGDDDLLYNKEDLYVLKRLHLESI